jgi:hypothetical protein
LQPCGSPKPILRLSNPTSWSIRTALSHDPDLWKYLV